MLCKMFVCTLTTALVVSGCSGSGSGDNEPLADDSQSLETILTTGATPEDTNTRWHCETANSVLTQDGFNTSIFRYYADFTGTEGTIESGTARPVNWQVNAAQELMVTFTDVDPAAVAIARDITLNADNTQFTASVEEDTSLGMDSANYTCNKTDDNAEAPSDGTVLFDQLVNPEGDEDGFSWACVYSNDSVSYIYTFNADGTGTDFSSIDEMPLPIDYVLTEPNAIRATYSNTLFSSLIWSSIVFSDASNFTAVDRTADDNSVAVTCTRQ